uniref:(northern house mosquito) hypothetical protein n=1 Tax=Culex pipiens TaxID=7175 RepID=A0A8D8BJF3_CULPI
MRAAARATTALRRISWLAVCSSPLVFSCFQLLFCSASGSSVRSRYGAVSGNQSKINESCFPAPPLSQNYTLAVFSSTLSLPSKRKPLQEGSTKMKGGGA